VIEIFDCEQGTPEWFQCRLGIPTASCFDKVLTKPQKGKSVSLTRRRYLHDLAGEIITGDPAYSYTNDHMERGREQEDEARRMYCFTHDVEPQRVGFIRNNYLRAGCSPDSLIGDDGGLEVKTKLAALLIECRNVGGVPAEHKPQTQGFLLITGREWIDLFIYCRKMEPYIVRVHRDEVYIADLKVALECFNEELDRVVERERNHRAPEEALREDLKASLLEVQA
jgi:hypothetical protein